MSASQLRIDGQEVSLGRVWPHLKSTPSRVSSYSLLVRGDYVLDVFDKKRSKPKGESWGEYIMRALDAFGGMMLAHYLRVLKELDGIVDEQPLWVITSVDSFKTVPEGILLEGAVEEFRANHVPLLKQIE